MKKMLVLAVFLLTTGRLWAGPVVTEVTDRSGPFNGYRITTPAYEFRLMCTPDYGFYGFEVIKNGESFFVDRTPFSIYDKESGEYFFQDCLGVRKASRSFAVGRDEKENKISWELNSNPWEDIDYGGWVEYGPNRVSVTQRWTMHRNVKRGEVTVADLLPGVPALTGCRFRAVLNDGWTVEGKISDKIIEEETVYASGWSKKSLKEVLFDTGQGKVKVIFVPDEYGNGRRGGEPRLANVLDKDWFGLSSRRYGLLCRFPAGRPELPRSYTIIFEFPE